MTYARIGPLPADRSYAYFLTALQPYASAFAVVAASTLIALFLVPPREAPLLAMADLPVIFVVAALWGPRAGTFAVLIAAVAYDYFWTEPIHSLRIYRLADVAIVGVLLLIAAIAAALGSRLRGRLDRHQASLSAPKTSFRERLLPCNTEMGVTWALCAELHRVFGCNAILLSKADKVRVVAGMPSNASLSPVDCAAATVAIEFGHAAGRGNQYVGTADWSFHPLWSADGHLAVGLARDDGKPAIRRSEIPLLAEMLEQAAHAFARTGANSLLLTDQPIT